MDFLKNIQRSGHWPFTLLLGLVFVPVFCTHFGAHTDGFFILTPKGHWLGDPEAGILFTQGRPLLAYFNSFVGWFVKSVEH